MDEIDARGSDLKWIIFWLGDWSELTEEHFDFIGVDGALSMLKLLVKEGRQRRDERNLDTQYKWK